MKETTIKQYTTSDNETFTIRSEAIAHQTYLDAGKEIAEFISFKNKLAISEGGGDPMTGRTISRITNTLSEWEVWKAQKNESNVAEIGEGSKAG